MKKRILFMFVLACLISSNAIAKVINVPKHYSTIQEAVDAAQDGDKIMVGSSYVGAGALIQDKSLTLVGGGALINDGPLYNTYYRAGFLVRGAASSGSSISHFTFKALEYPIFVESNAQYAASIDDITISHNTIQGTAARQAITLRGTKRGMVNYNRIDYARFAAIVGSGGDGRGNEAFTAMHNVIDFSQCPLMAYTGIATNATRGAVITHNKIKIPITPWGEAIYVVHPVGDESQIISYNDLRGSAWDYWDSDMRWWMTPPYTPMYPVIYQRNFSDAGAFPAGNRGIEVP